jgi:hypothetical protein
MTPELVFTLSNGLAVVAWILLAALPGQRWVTDIVAGRLVPGFFAVAYIAIVVTVWPQSQGSFSTLAGVSTLFDHPWLLMAGWLHYLAFDMLTGVWEVRDARERGVPHLLVVPCLFLTLMFGPAGWLGYVIVSRFAQGKAGLHEVR